MQTKHQHHNSLAVLEIEPRRTFTSDNSKSNQFSDVADASA